MADYQNLSPSIFDEPEYEDTTELLVMIYIMLNRDMAGVCPWNEKVVAAKCRTSIRKLRRIIERMQMLGKVKKGINGNQLWLKAGIYFTLYKGHCSSTQMSSVVDLLFKWDQTKAFGDNFGIWVVQLYASKYNLSIPYPLGKPAPRTEAEAEFKTETETKTESKAEAGVSPTTTAPTGNNSFVCSVKVNGQSYSVINLEIPVDKYSELKSMFLGIDHDYELMMADLKRPNYPGSGKKRNDLAYLTKWFKRALDTIDKGGANERAQSNKGFSKAGKTNDGQNEGLSKYDQYA